jgi:predicted Zn finger-like uncharacterized protein
MIIQCKQCRTKFRFDGAQMEGDGLWMRCSRCQHVFFQENPAIMKPSAGLACETAAEPLPEKTEKRLSSEPAESATVMATPDDDMKSFLDEVMAPEKNADVALKAAPRDADHDGIRIQDIDFSVDAENADEAFEAPELTEEALPPPRKKGRAWKVALWALLVIVMIPALIYFFFFPQMGERYVKIAQKFIGGGVSQSADGQSVTGQVKLEDIRQRIVNNYILGNIRIVEGIAVNQADFPISRIRVKGEILDAYAVVLDERISYAGNILTDEELTNMSEEDIAARLSLTEGRDNSNEKILPNGRIPFMIIFTSEPPGSIKTTVMIIGAERLL